ncbi:MAG: GNAT family N-acetyltransferase [Flavobacteriaceae bacterium]|nr:GNAT family N-acetyltransferase [Flavobacteriaceae bacterium]|tara:strand:+ start:6568 stop:7050 length:483 start_codon:yes stop_codon:yes gene_type:complete
MNVEIRPAKENEMNDVLSLIKELAIFEKEPNAVTLTSKDLIAHAFSSPPLFICYVAIFKSVIVGMFLGYPRYSTWKGPTMHLEDLIVTKKMRNKGIGRALFSSFINFSYSKGVKRVEWAVLKWNTAAIKFYESNGAKIYNDWQIVQMNEKAIHNFILNKK